MPTKALLFVKLINNAFALALLQTQIETRYFVCYSKSMLLFTLFLIPCVTLLYLANSSDKAYRVVFLSGFLSGLLVTICTFIFSFLHRVPEYSFSSNFSYYAIREYVFPLILLYLLFFFLTKEELEFKVRSFFFLECGFFTIYMPYFIIVSCPSSFSIYELFLKPLIWLSMISLSSVFIRSMVISSVGKNKLKFIISILLLAFTLFIPPFLNTLWILNWLKIVFIVFSSIYILSGLIALALGLLVERD